MSILLVTVGMSGSGKNHLLKKIEPHFGAAFKVVEPDDIRRKVLGSVNDQSQGGRVFAIAGSSVKAGLKKGQIVYFNCTNLNWSNVKKAVAGYTEGIENVSVMFIFMMDSEDYDLCRGRVEKDLNKGTDRSEVPADIMKKQHERFAICLKNATEDEGPGNWSMYLYRGDSDDLIKEIDELWEGD